MTEIWAQKYRPKQWEDFVGQEDIVQTLRSGGYSHHIFYSREPGVGKTTLAKLLAEKHALQIHIYNASSKKQRGIEFIEEEILPMSRTGNYNQIFLLDEADQLTAAAQSALKGVIENAQGYFILTCNDLSKITPWLKSRCNVFTFKPIPADIIIDRLKVIAAKEGCDVSVEHINMIADIHEGDLRNSINALQLMHTLDENTRNLTLLRMADELGPNMNLFLRSCFRDKDMQVALSYLEGYDVRNSIRSIFRYCVADSRAATASKMRVIEAAVVSERDLISGVDESIVKYNFTRMCVGE